MLDGRNSMKGRSSGEKQNGMRRKVEEKQNRKKRLEKQQEEGSWFPTHLLFNIIYIG